MMSFLIKTLITAIALWVATIVVDGVHVGGGSPLNKGLILVVVAVIFGVVNAVIKPIVKLLALPFYIITLGLITFIINAFMLWLTGKIAGGLSIPFEASPFFWAAVLGALVVSIVSFLLNLIIPDGD